MHDSIRNYNNSQSPEDKAICELLAEWVDKELTEADSKIWHGHPVWFIESNPIVGYSKQKPGIRFMFWSGADFGEEKLDQIGKKFKDASIFFTSITQINPTDLVRWLRKARDIQWDYKNIIKRKGKLERLK
ncbi:MAG: DUF1801 domain-containing protein [Saprospiraceae bacterium]|nr:DUF1801 domain-containing protein [Saprospiraceae bacterium]